jgi:hypothetical protein
MMLRQIYPNANSWVNPDLEWQLFAYVGTPHARPSALRPVGPAFFMPDRRLQLG